MERHHHRRRRELRAPRTTNGGLSPATRLRIAADVHRHSTSDDDSGCVLEEYTWWPSGLRPDTVHAYFAALPEDKVPYVGSVGEKWRSRQLRHQLPPHDSDPRYCSELTPEEAEELRLFDRARKAECIGVGTVEQTPYDSQTHSCRTCGIELEEGTLTVFSSRTDSYFHPSCFTCHECRVLLVDLIYFSHDGHVYCGRHHAEQIKPRCARCDELILGEECTEAEGRTWHLHHFQCSECAQLLGGCKYMQRGGKPVCLTCFHSSTSSLRCASCRGMINLDTPHISQSDLSWHASTTCFCCVVCAKNLLGLNYSLHENRLYCGQHGCQQVNSTKYATGRPKPPQRAPPPPPEGIYETVLPCTSSPIQKKKGYDRETANNYYSRTPNRSEELEYSTSSSDSEDEVFYMNNSLQPVSISRSRPIPCKLTIQPGNGVRQATKKKSSRCIVS